MTRRALFASLAAALAGLLIGILPQPPRDPQPDTDDAAYIARLRRVIRTRG